MSTVSHGDGSSGARPLSGSDGQFRRDEVQRLVDAERTSLIAVLAGLDEEQWGTPSLCAGWTVRDAVVHVLMPYELSLPRFVGRIAASGFRFDAMADRWARRDTRAPRALLNALETTAAGRFRVPGAPVEAPLSHLVIHLEDILRPLAVTRPPNPRAAEIVLDQMTGPRFARALSPGLLDRLSLVASDADWAFGTGTRVDGTASALITTLAGRTAALHELSGPGATLLRSRVES